MRWNWYTKEGIAIGIVVGLFVLFAPYLILQNVILNIGATVIAEIVLAVTLYHVADGIWCNKWVLSGQKYDRILRIFMVYSMNILLVMGGIFWLYVVLPAIS